MISLDGSSKFTFFSKYVTKAIPNVLTQSRCMHSGSYHKTITTRHRQIFKNVEKKRKIAN